MKFMMVMIICFAQDVCEAVFDNTVWYNSYDECVSTASGVAGYMKDAYPDSAGNIFCMTEEEAKKFLTDRGISENIPGYKDFIYKVSTTDAEQLGTPAIFAGKPIEFNIETEGSEIRSVITNQIQGSLPDSQYSTKQKKLRH